MMANLNQQDMPSLQFLFAGITNIEHDLAVSMVSVDAREITTGGMFLAVAGSQQHGLKYASQAVINGANVIAYDPAAGGKLLARGLKNSNVLLLCVESLAAKVSEIANRFYDFPSSKLAVIGITGTNGKTSVSHYLAQALSVKSRCGVIGTLGWGLIEKLAETINTTPDAVSVQAQLAAMKEQGADTIVMEVSSHGLDQGRVSAVQFKGAVFTNLSHDHLDYHGSMDAYGEAKKALFTAKGLQFAVLNLDDEFSEKILPSLDKSVDVYGVSRHKNSLEKANLLYIDQEKISAEGVQFGLQYGEQNTIIQSSLLGRFNIDNLVSTIAVQLALGLSFQQAVANTQNIKAVAGRMEHILPQDLAVQMPRVVVDFAHTPEALSMALSSLKASCEGRLITVFGCGGDRDQSKREEMGRIAAKFAEKIILTADNPRSESAELITQQIKAGIDSTTSVVVEMNREKAIELAITTAEQADTILIAGKGHENYQEIAGTKYPFSDVACAEKVLEKSALMVEEACKQ